MTTPDEVSERIAKLRPKIQNDWEDLDRMSSEELERKIIECQANLMVSEREKRNDRELNTAKDNLAALNAPYKEAKSRLSVMLEYMTLRLEQSGKL